MQFSKRTNWNLDTNELTNLVNQYKQNSTSFVNLTLSNPTKAGFKFYQDTSLLENLTNPQALTYTPLSQGLLETRKEVSQYYKNKSCDIDPSQIILTASTSEGYSYLFRLLCNAYDHVLLPRPSYPLFKYLADVHDVTYDFYDLVYQDNEWSINLKSIEANIKSNTKAIILVSPNNPTGSCVNLQELEIIKDVAQKSQLSIICDEVFLDYSLEKDINIPKTLASCNDVPMFVLSGLSKTLALPQMKLSWIVCNGSKNFVDQAMQRLDVIADTFLSVSTPIQLAARSWLRSMPIIQGEIRDRITHNMKFLKEICQKNSNVQCFTVQAGWYAIISSDCFINEEQFVFDLLKEERIYLHPGFYFDFNSDGHLILSLLVKEEDFKLGVNCLFAKI